MLRVLRGLFYITAVLVGGLGLFYTLGGLTISSQPEANVRGLAFCAAFICLLFGGLVAFSSVKGNWAIAIGGALIAALSLLVAVQEEPLLAIILGLGGGGIAIVAMLICGLLSPALNRSANAK